MRSTLLSLSCSHGSLGRPAQSQNNCRFQSKRQHWMKILNLTSILRPEVAHQSTRARCKPDFYHFRGFKLASKCQGHILGQIVILNLKIFVVWRYWIPTKCNEITYHEFGFAASCFHVILLHIYRCFQGKIQNQMRELTTIRHSRRFVWFRQRFEITPISLSIFKEK